MLSPLQPIIKNPKYRKHLLDILLRNLAQFDGWYVAKADSNYTVFLTRKTEGSIMSHGSVASPKLLDIFSQAGGIIEHTTNTITCSHPTKTEDGDEELELVAAECVMFGGALAPAYVSQDDEPLEEAIKEYDEEKEEGTLLCF